MSRKPQKPYRPAEWLSFLPGVTSFGVPVRREFPRDKVELERSVVESFGVQFNTQYGDRLREIRVSDDEPFDAVAILDKRHRVGIQIAEVIDHDRRAITQTRKLYDRALSNGRLASKLQGFSVHISESHDPLLPSIGSSEGITMLAMIEMAVLQSVSKALAGSQSLEGPHAPIHIKLGNAYAWCTVSRQSSGEAPFKCTWPHPIYMNAWQRADYRPKNWALDTLRMKVSKSYAKPSDHHFWLLLYTVDPTVISPANAHDDKRVEELEREVEGNQTFDHIWLFGVLGPSDGGHLDSIKGAIEPQTS